MFYSIVDKYLKKCSHAPRMYPILILPPPLKKFPAKSYTPIIRIFSTHSTVMILILNLSPNFLQEHDSPDWGILCNRTPPPRSESILLPSPLFMPMANLSYLVSPALRRPATLCQDITWGHTGNLLSIINN